LWENFFASKGERVLFLDFFSDEGFRERKIKPLDLQKGKRLKKSGEMNAQNHQRESSFIFL